MRSTNDETKADKVLTFFDKEDRIYLKSFFAFVPKIGSTWGEAERIQISLPSNLTDPLW